MYKQHYLLAWGGKLFNDEIWSCSMRLAQPNDGHSWFDMNNLGKQALVDDLVSDIRTYMASSLFTQHTVCDWVKLNPIGEDGKYADSAATYERRLAGTTGATAVIKGTNTTSAVPPQLAVAITLRTSRQRGVGSKGRFFLPGLVMTVSGGLATTSTSDGRLQDASVNAASPLGVATKTFLQNVNNWPSVDGWVSPRIVVASQGGRNHPDPLNEPVTGFSIGRVIDTQRRRRNNLAETPSLVNL